MAVILRLEKCREIHKYEYFYVPAPNFINLCLGKGHTVVQLVEALRYKPEDRGFNSRWCHWNFSLT